MIKSKQLLMRSIIVLLIAMILNFPYPHRYSLGELLLMKVNIPIQSKSGFFYIGIMTSILLILGLYMLVKSVKKYHGRLVLMTVILFSLIPMTLISIFQSTFANGVYAISFDKEQSECHFEKVETTVIHGNCYLSIQNHSNKDIEFTLAFQEEFMFEDDPPVVSLMNDDAPYRIVINKKETKQVYVESFIDVSQMENHIDGGSANIFDIVIEADGKAREL